MSSSWILKTRQMSEAGKEILIREALATHLRSVRDRQFLASILGDPRPLEDILSFFASFYLYHYQGVRLLSTGDVETLDADKKDVVSQEERRQLELEIRQLLGDCQRQEIYGARLVCEFNIQCCELASKISPTGSDFVAAVSQLITKYLSQLPRDYSPNISVDFVGEVTGWADEWRRELYFKASGLKESSMSLRDELLREHEYEVIETSILKRLVNHLTGRIEYLNEGLTESNLHPTVLEKIARAVAERFSQLRSNLLSVKLANQFRLALIELLEREIDVPTTVNELESRFADVATEHLAQLTESHPDLFNDVLSQFLKIDSRQIRTTLMEEGISDPSALVRAMQAVKTSSLTQVSQEERPQQTPEELEAIERSLRTLEKIEDTLERQVKGLLRSRGLRSSELDKITVVFLTKDRRSLMGIEMQVFEELQKKIRLPSPTEVEQLLKVRERARAGGVSGQALSSSAEMTQQRRLNELAVTIRFDIVWHFMLGILTHITRVIETYIRAKQDLLREKALLKSIYSDAYSELQSLQEEVLIELTSMRINEMKCVHPDLDAKTICAWYHARLSSNDIRTAATELEMTPSPLFEGIANTPLAVGELTFDNYAIAYDIMQRFLRRERESMLTKEQVLFEARVAEQKRIESKKSSLDVLLFIYTKAHTVFRAISRVGTRGLEWDSDDTAKCANLLSFHVLSNRGRPVCQVCGSTPSDGVCLSHGKANIVPANDVDSLSVFVMRAISDIKSGLIGPTAKPFTWDEARSVVQRELTNLRQRGKITSKTNVRSLLPGEVSHIVGPAIASIIGDYFNESLQYAARRAGIA